MKPYEAVILGRKQMVQGWDEAGNLLLEDGQGFALAEMHPLPTDIRSKKLLRVARLEHVPVDGEATVWALDGEPLDQRFVLTVKQLKDSCSLEFFGMCVLRHELEKSGETNAVGVAWFEDSNGNKGWDHPVMLRCLREIRPSPELVQRERLAFQERENMANQRRILEDQKEAIRQGNLTVRQTAEKFERLDSLNKTADLYANPSMAEAKAASIKKMVPTEFVAYCHTKMHVEKFPSVDRAFRAVQTEAIFSALRDPQSPSRATVGRWLRIIREELERRQLIQRRSRQKAIQRAANYDVSRHPSVPLEEVDQEMESDGRSAPDTRGQELET